jgi:hypothetical protein
LGDGDEYARIDGGRGGGFTRGKSARRIVPTRGQMGPSDITTLLRAWSKGDLRARDQLVPVLYDELHRRAAACLRRERRDHTL